MAAIIQHFKGHKGQGQKVLVISHRKEILYQTQRTMKQFINIDTGTYFSKKKDLSHDVVIGSIQSCARSYIPKELVDNNFDILIIDEAHHSTAKTYRLLISKINAKLLLGFTATPDLSNGNTLGEIYQKVTYSRQIKDLIEQDHLSDIHGRKIRIELELKNILVDHGDYSKFALSKVMNKDTINTIIVKKYKEHVKKGKAIAFCVDIKHAITLSKEFNKQGVKSKAIYGELPEHHKKKRINNLKDGKLDILTSVGVLTEGFDMPEINTIVMARPTKSKSLYIQMVGRGLRRTKDKTKCFVLDFIDTNHSLKQALSLDIAIPHAKVEKDVIIGDYCKVPIQYDDYDIHVREIFDNELALLQTNKLITTNNNKRQRHPYCKTYDNQQKLKKGELNGKAPFGYKNIKTIVANEQEAEIVKFAFKEYVKENQNLTSVAKAVSKKFNFNKSRGAIGAIISNPFHCGIIDSPTYGKYNHVYEKIIPQSLFALAEHKRNLLAAKKRSKHLFLYKRLIKCYHCGCAVSGHMTQKNKYKYYNCNQNKPNIENHNATRFREHQIDQTFIDALSNIELSENIIATLTTFFKNKYQAFAKMTDKEIKFIIYKLRNNAHSLFANTTDTDKRKLIQMIFCNIQAKDDQIIYDLNPPFDKIMKAKK